MTLAAVVALSLSGCSSPFESWMSEGCDGLRQMASALEAGDRQAMKDATWGSFDPATEQAAKGQERADVRAAFDAASELYSASRHTPSEAWPSLQLTDEQQIQVKAGLAACEDY